MRIVTVNQQTLFTDSFFQENGAGLLRCKIRGENVRTGMLYLEVEYYAVERFCCKGMKYMKTMGKQ